MSITPRSSPRLEILQIGPQCLVQDLGRPGRASEGITISGAADRHSLIQGNRLLGNDIGAPGLETLFGGVAARPDGDVLVTTTGAWCPVTVDGTPVSFGAVTLVRAGSVLRLGAPTHGARTYLTVRGGLTPGGEFGGSWSTDTSSGLGPDPVRAGDLLPVGDRISGRPIFREVPPAIRPVGDLTLHITLGPRPSTVNAADRAQLSTGAGVISGNSDRIGVRINGFNLSTPQSSGSSEALPLGAVQAPPSGELIVFLADHPTTGGYPVIGVVDGADLDALAQCTPGQSVRFAVRPTPALPAEESPCEK